MINLCLILGGTFGLLVVFAYVYYKIRKTAQQEIELKTLTTTLKEVENVKKINNKLATDSDIVVSERMQKYIRDKD